MTTVPFYTSALRTGIPFGIAMSPIFILQSGISSGAIMGAIAGLFFGLSMAAFGSYQSKKLRSQRPDFEDEELIEEGPANHFVNGEGVGGWLFLTDKRLFFKSHGVNIQRHELSIPLSDITNLAKAKSLWVVPNRLNVQLKNGKVERFVLNKRDLWKREIEEQIWS